jgi:acyl-coenzyme A synthetase/AMP-(fatty) acid ligase
VIGIPDELRGQNVHACIVITQGFDATELLRDELRDFIRGRIAVYKCPRSIEFLSALPRSATGKVQRQALRAASKEPTTHAGSR